MAPILIDKPGLVKLGLISVLTLVIFFAVGFFSGYQQATKVYTDRSAAEVLVLPEQTAAQENDVLPQQPDDIAAGAEIDVDQPQSKASNAVNTAAIVNKIHKPAKQGMKGNKKQPTDNKKPGNNRVVSVSDYSVKVGVPAVKTQPVDFVNISALPPEDIKKIKYSVQVGTFGRLDNAEKMVATLHEKQLDAYASEYTNKQNLIKYNVRFGYFTDKQSARRALKEFKNKQKSDGYLVNFSIKRIVGLAKENSPETHPYAEKKQQALSSGAVAENIISLEASMKNVAQPGSVKVTKVIVEAQKPGLVGARGAARQE